MEMNPTPILPHELRVTNYFICEDRPVRLLGLNPLLTATMQFPLDYQVDLLDLQTRICLFHIDVARLSPVPLTPEILLLLGFEEEEAGNFPTDLPGVYCWPIDSASYWLASFVGEDVTLWFMRKHESPMNLVGISHLHQLQNVFWVLEELELRFDHDQDTISSRVADSFLNGTPLY